MSVLVFEQDVGMRLIDVCGVVKTKHVDGFTATFVTSKEFVAMLNRVRGARAIRATA